ncbi:uncharacterized protein LOC131948824 [Physella acuta]|uniref:uncharacterized protein LOC131948824 n=1 Tax=Physella acuta TaxID=109671 RepID=UPI0027DC283E|nr:uncharacterized protein LOC131948824 [Physella acuta]
MAADVTRADIMAADVTRTNVTSPDVTRSNASGYDTGDVSPPNAGGARDGGGGDVRVADSYLAVPVSAWGVRYFLVTLQSRPAVHLVTADDSTGIQVVLRSSEPALFALKYLAKTYRNGDTLHIRLGRWQVLPLFDCWNNTYAGDVTGTIITSTMPVGVTSGRCVTCEGDAGIVFTTQEMLLPAATYGWNFVLVTDLDQMDTTLVTVVTSENLTLIGLWLEDSNDVSTWITNTGDMLQVNLTSRPRLLSSTKPVLVTVALQVRCQGSSVAMGTPTLILPTSLFYNTYLWRPLTNCSVQVRCHVTFVVEREVAATLVLDHVHVTSGWVEWTVGTLTS